MYLLCKEQRVVVRNSQYGNITDGTIIYDGQTKLLRGSVAYLEYAFSSADASVPITTEHHPLAPQRHVLSVCRGCHADMA